ncbi:hypothetical protein Bca101_008043 [Brassica carinata]
MVSLETTPALQLPVIDFTSPNLKPGTVEWDSVRGDVRRALEEYGCFEALYDKVPVQLREAVFNVSEEAFQLPLETKQRVVSKRKYRGYVCQIPTLPLFEVMGVDFAENEDKVNEFTHKLWPQGNASFRQTFEVDECLMRMMKHQGVEETEEELGMEVHTDRNMLTILCQNDVKDGLEVLLNCRVATVVHRVMRTGTKTRFSAGLFSVPKKDHLIYAPDEIVDAEHPRLFKPFDFEAYFQFTTEGPGRRDLAALRTYCGL